MIIEINLSFILIRTMPIVNSISKDDQNISILRGSNINLLPN